MGNISMVQPGEHPFVRARDTITRELADDLLDDLLDTESRHLFGGPDELEVFEVRLAPDTVVTPHAHVSREEFLRERGSSDTD